MSALKSLLRTVRVIRPKYVERYPRVKLLPLGRISFQVKSHPPEILVPVTNISTTGLGLLREEARAWPAAGTIVSGSLLFDDHATPVQVRVVHVSKFIVGCAFVDPAAVGPEIEKYFALEFSAVRLEAVKPEVLKEESDGKPHLYRGGEHCELFFVESGGKIVRFEITLFGNFIEGTAKGEVRCGVIDKGDADSGKPRHKASDMVRYEKTVSQEILALTARFLGNIRSLSENYREQLLHRLRGK